MRKAELLKKIDDIIDEYGVKIRFGNKYMLFVHEAPKPYACVVEGWPGISDEVAEKNLTLNQALKIVEKSIGIVNAANQVLDAFDCHGPCDCEGEPTCVICALREELDKCLD